MVVLEQLGRSATIDQDNKKKNRVIISFSHLSGMLRYHTNVREESTQETKGRRGIVRTQKSDVVVVVGCYDDDTIPPLLPVVDDDARR